MADVLTITQDYVQERFTSAIRLYVGLGKKYSVEAVADASGIPYATMKAYHEGRNTPGLFNLLRIMAVLPPEFGNMILAATGYVLMPQDAGEATSLFLNRHAADFTSLCAQHLEDGRIDLGEEREQAPKVRALLAACTAWLKRHDRATS